MAHDINDDTTAFTSIPHGWSTRRTLQIDRSDSTTLSNVIWIDPGVTGAVLECGVSDAAITGSFSICDTYGGTFIPLVRPYSTGNAASITLENPVIVTVSQAASAMNVTDLLQGGGFFLKVVMSGAETTADLFLYLRLVYQ